MKLEAKDRLTVATPKLPNGVVAVQQWQSASRRLDMELIRNLAKAGVFLYFVEDTSDNASGDYMKLLISKRKIPLKELQADFSLVYY